jgi:hypothetical protein
MNLDLAAFARMIAIPTYVVVAYAIASVATCAAIGVRLYRAWQVHKVLKGVHDIGQQLASVLDDLDKVVQDQNPSLKENMELLVSSSSLTSSNPSSIVIGEFTILKQQIEELRSRMEQSKSEIIEVQRIDPILEATLKYAVEHLTNRIDALEKTSLTKWDVVVVVFQVIIPSATLVGLALAILKYLHP